MKTQTVSRRLLCVSGLIASALLAAGCPSGQLDGRQTASRGADTETPEQPALNTLAFQSPMPENPAPKGKTLASPTASLPAPESAIAESRPTPVAGKASEKESKADPIERNGPIFVDWPKPVAAILISGEQIGYLEPCGCAGLENMKGGLKRRHTLIKQLRQQGWPLIAVDLGGQVKRFGRQATMKYAAATGALVEMQYEAIGFGPQDLRLPTEDIVSVAVNFDEGKNPFVAANVKLLGIDEMVSPFRVETVGGKRIAVTSILGKSEIAKINNPDVQLSDPEQALAKVVPEMSKRANYLVLLSHAKPEESEALARKFPRFNLVATAGGAAEPPSEPKQIEGTKAQLVEVGHKGMYVAVIGLFDDERTPMRYQRVPLDHRFADSPEMQQVLVKYQDELRTLGFETLGLTGTAYPNGVRFVGSGKCAECHIDANDVFEKTPHSHALETLVKLDPPRHFDPECISCHVVGWNSQKYFPYKSGYRDPKTTKHLGDVGCENCHGPGAAHVAAEESLETTEEELQKRRKEVQILLIEGEAEGKLPEGVVGRVTAKCQECHDLDNSPEFDFKTYWPKVEHWGME